ncbi:type II methionyl aminopeptidase [Candidatus Woesearchaeota archaeon]|nr:type II methionyl aminopeptidase [Candidatus Woesearchaeota archaeon]
MTPKEAYLRAGKIHYEVCERSKSLIKPGASLLDIARKIESYIAEHPEASLAFPINLQLNNEVHYSPVPNDTRTITKEDIIKVDVGVHVEGYIADGAYTIALNKDYQDMVDFTEEVLRKTITGLKPGMKVSEIGKRLDKLMEGSKYKIIKNLMGHQVQQWDLHSTKSVFVYESSSPNTMEPGEAFAIEIFITDGAGHIKSSPTGMIYAMKKKLLPVRDTKIRKLCQIITEKRKSLPFTERYVTEHLGYSRVDFLNLKRSNNLNEYAHLLEIPGSKIAQFEDIIYMDKDKVIITTKP